MTRRPGFITALAICAAALLVAVAPATAPGAHSAGLGTVPPLALQPAAPIAQIFGNGQLDGRMLFIKDGDLWMYEQGNAHVAAIGATWTQPRWAPDGERFAYTYRGDKFSEIFVADFTGDPPTRLTRSQSSILDNNTWNFWPTWSPDGTRLAFVSDAAAYNPTLWLMDATDGTGRRQISIPGVVQQAADKLSWSPDGSTLAATVFAGSAPSQVHLVPMGAENDELPGIATSDPAGAIDPAWSPDGAWLAYAGRAAFSGTDVYVQRADSTGRVRITSSGLARGPSWSPDGKHLAYLSARSGDFNVWVVDVSQTSSGLAATNERQLTHDLNLDATSGISWAR